MSESGERQIERNEATGGTGQGSSSRRGRLEPWFYSRGDTRSYPPDVYTPLLHSSGSSPTETMREPQTGAEDAPSDTDFSALFMDFIRRYLCCGPDRRGQSSSTQDASTPADAPTPAAHVERQRDVERLTREELQYRSDTNYPALDDNEIDAIKKNIANGILNEQKAKMKSWEGKNEGKDKAVPDKKSDIFSDFRTDDKGVLIVTTGGSRYVHSIDLKYRYIGINDTKHNKGDLFFLSQATFLSWSTIVTESGRKMKDIRPSIIAVSFVSNAEALATAKPFVEADCRRMFKSGSPGYYGAGIANPLSRSILYLLAQHSNDLGKPHIDNVEIERYTVSGEENLRMTYNLKYSS